MATSKIKRGEEYVDYDLLRSDVEGGWDNYTSDYEFGKDFDFNKMQALKAIILDQLASGNLVYTPSTDSRQYNFIMNTSVPELQENSNERRYALGYIGNKLLRANAIKEEPWNANTWFMDSLKNGYFNGQTPDFSIFATPEILKAEWPSIINSINLDNVPEDKRAEYEAYKAKALGFMDNGYIDPEEIPGLATHFGISANVWKPFMKPTEQPKVEAPKKEIKTPSNNQTVAKPQDVKYETYKVLNLISDDKANLYKEVLELTPEEFKQDFTNAINSPDEYEEYLPYLMLRKLDELKAGNTGKIDLGVSSPDYKFFFDIDKNEIVKAHKNNFAVHQNVETPKVESKTDS